MTESSDEPNGFDRFRRAPRKSIRLTETALIKTGYLPGASERFPLVIEPNEQELNPADWARGQRDFIKAELHRHGALLFRGFRIETAAQYEQFARAVFPELLNYLERAAPRVEVERNIYTSTEYPADQAIPLHHEMSYSHNWPRYIMFYCARPAQSGGATPIADDRKVFKLIDPAIKERFLQKKVMYVRNYGEGVDLSWREAFQTDDRAAVEAYCRLAHMTCEWRDGDRLRTRAVRQVLATHPATGETVWFNHAHMFHISNVEPAARAALLAQFAPDELPRNAFYGDGTSIEDSVASEIREVYRAAAVLFPWQRNDLLLLDNFLASHGREPFVGPRQVLVAMAELFTNTEL